MNVSDLINLVLAAAALVIAVIEVRDVLYNKRKENFLLIYRELSINQRKLRKMIREFYNAQGLPVGERTYLYYPQAWQKILPIKNVMVRQAGFETDREEEQAAAAYERIAADAAKAQEKLCREFGRKKLMPLNNRNLSDNLLTFTDARIVDLPIYALQEVRVDEQKEQVTLLVRSNTYFDFINTCFPFGYEAANCMIKSRMDNKHGKQMTLRKKYDIFNFANRCASIGTITMVVLENIWADEQTRGDFFFLHKRGGNVAESKGLIDAIPAGTFQPTSESAMMDMRQALAKEGIIHTIVREFYEEIFAKEEFSLLSSVDELTETALFQIMERKTYYLAGGVDPINMHFNVIALSLLDGEDCRAIFGSDRLSEIKKQVKSNDEGGVSIEPFNEIMLNHYELHYKSTPGLKEICKIIQTGDVINYIHQQQNTEK